MIVYTKEAVKKEELTHHVAKVTELDDEVGDCKIVTLSLATDNEAVLSDDLLDARVATLTVLALCQ